MAHPSDSIRETAFEKKRGISHVEVRTGFAQIRVSGLAHPWPAERLRVLEAIADAGISIDFLKLAPAGATFMVPDADAARAAETLQRAGIACELLENRHIVLAHAANMRDEEGLIARVMSEAIGSGVGLEHVTDMHNRILIVVGSDDSAPLADRLRTLEADA